MRGERLEETGRMAARDEANEKSEREKERQREGERLVCRTSAGLVSAAAGGQTGCPDSTEGRLCALLTAGRERQPRTPATSLGLERAGV